MKITLPMLLLATPLVVFVASGDASAQARRARAAPPAEILCLESLEVGNARDLASALLRGGAVVEADHQTNCLVVIGAADTATVRRVLGALDDRARARNPRDPAPPRSRRAVTE